MQTLLLGGGCFWCLDAVYRQIKGVQEVISGYAGGAQPNPSYEQVCSGTTGHVEVVQIHYDPEQISEETLLEAFWYVHDPTTLNRQGADVGTQYRSIVFYNDADQKRRIEESRDEAQTMFEKPVVTEIAPVAPFYPAEAYHQDYFANNPEQGYCRMVVAPKVAKFREFFGALQR